uniref:DnaJ homolog subfamily C member 9 n=1 Tax=Caligus rogercresseyi TaxID=217165 RepID=C1BNY7_CALRO|nr:DnaJ homolog subfamily C member 9 [Caligus rogercresseyi]
MTEKTWKDRIQSLFGTKCPYDALGVAKDCSENAIRKGYYRSSLQCHPDRIQDDSLKEEATEKFQALGAIYGALRDPEKRKLYDDTGVLFDEQENVANWSEYWRVFYKKITMEDIENFRKEFQGSEEESEQLKAAYLKYKGSMIKIIHNVLACDDSDEPRFTDIIREWINEGSVPSFPAFTSETEEAKKLRKRKAKNEAKRAEKALKELGVDSDSDLGSLIAKRQKEREAASSSFLDALAAKYSNSGSPSGKKKRKTSKK